MRKIKIILILCIFSLPIFGQTKIVTIKKGTVYWERTIPKKKYKKYLKTGEIDKIKTRIYNIAYQNAVMQESSVVSIINSISAFDETNPESAVDAVYTAFQSYSKIEWIEGPFKLFKEKETSIFGNDAVVVSCIVYGKFRRTFTNNLPDNDYFISEIHKNKSKKKNVVIKKNKYSYGAFNYTLFTGLKLWYTRRKIGIGFDFGVIDGSSTDKPLYMNDFKSQFGNLYAPLMDSYFLFSLPYNILLRKVEDPWDDFWDNDNMTSIFQIYPIVGIYFPQKFKDDKEANFYYDNPLFTYGAGISGSLSVYSIHIDITLINFRNELIFYPKFSVGIVLPLY